MLEHDITDVLELTFTAETDFFGKKDTVELVAGGRGLQARSLFLPGEGGVARGKRGLTRASPGLLPLPPPASLPSSFTRQLQPPPHTF